VDWVLFISEVLLVVVTVVVARNVGEYAEVVELFVSVVCCVEARVSTDVIAEVFVFASAGLLEVTGVESLLVCVGKVAVAFPEASVVVCGPVNVCAVSVGSAGTVKIVSSSSRDSNDLNRFNLQRLPLPSFK